MQTSAKKTYEKKSNKNTKKLLAGIFIICLLIAGIFLAYFIFKPKQNISNNLPFKNLYKYDSDLDYLIIHKEGKEDIRLSNDDKGVYAYLDNKKQYLSSDYQELILSYAKSLDVEYVVSESNAGIMPLMGLARPKLSVDVYLKDGTAYTMLIGNPIPLDYEVYFRLAGKEGVYTVPLSVYEAFSTPLNKLVDIKRIPIVRQLIKSIDIKKYNQQTISIITTAIENQRAYGNIQLEEDKQYPISSQKLSQLLDDLANFQAGEYVKELEQGDMQKYFPNNLSIDISIDQYAGKLDTISIEAQKINFKVSKIDDFTLYLLYKDNIYKASSITFASVLDADLDSLLSQKLINLSLGDISNIAVLSINDDVYRVSQNTSKENLFVRKNQESYSLEAFQNMLKKLLQLSGNKRVKNIDISKYTNLVYNISIVQSDTSKLSINIYEYDNFNYIYSINGIALFTADKANVDTLLK